MLKAKKFHPDHNKDPKAAETFKEILAAYQILKDEKKRSEYDSNFNSFGNQSYSGARKTQNYSQNYTQQSESDSQKRYGNYTQKEWEEIFQRYQQHYQRNKEAEFEYYRRKREAEERQREYERTHQTHYKYQNEFYGSYRDFARAQQKKRDSYTPIFTILLFLYVVIYTWNVYFTRKTQEIYSKKAKKKIDDLD